MKLTWYGHSAFRIEVGAMPIQANESNAKAQEGIFAGA